MTKLHAREVDLFRSLKKTAIVLMLLFRLDRPLGECEIAGILEMDRGTIRIYLRSLARLGMVTRCHRYHGWILTAGGRQMVLGEATFPVAGDGEHHWQSFGLLGNREGTQENPPSLPATAPEASGMAEISTWMVENPSSSAENSSTMVESPPSLPATKARTMVEKPPSMAKNPSSMVENPHSLAPSTAKAGARVENPPSMADNPPSMAENPSSSAENPPSPSLAAASLSLNSLSLKAIAAAAIPAASAEIPRSNAEFPPSSGKICRSRLKPRMRKVKDADGTANGSGKSEPMIQQNLRAFASIGLAQNDFVLGICRMDHVTPAYILGQKRRLEAERRYSAGLLLQVVKCGDFLAEEYVGNATENPPRPPLVRGEQNATERRSPAVHPLIRGEKNPPRPPLIRGEKRRAQLLEGEVELEEEDSGLEIESDPSIHEPLSASGITAAEAWAAVLRELQSDMPKAAYDKWIRDAVLLSARNGTFVIGAKSAYARDWLESRLTSTIARLLAGICNRSIQVKFINLNLGNRSAD